MTMPTYQSNSHEFAIAEHFKEVVGDMLPLLLAHKVDRVDKETDMGKFTAYWVNNVIRVDIIPYD